MIIEILLLNTIQSGKSSLCKAPETLDTIDVLFASRELIGSMMNSIVLFISHIYQSIICSPSIRIDLATQFYLVSDDRFQSFCLAVWNDFCIDLSVSLQ